jgi:hypothetical protein
MKPFQSGAVVSAWLLRVMLAWFVYKNYFHTFTDLDLESFSFYMSAAYLLCTVLLIAGGLLQKPTLTIVSGLLIFILPIVQLIRVFPEDLADVLLLYLIPLSVGFCFFTSGNQT